MDYSKSDWKLFRERIGDWQESYIEKLNHQYGQCDRHRRYLQFAGKYRYTFLQSHSDNCFRAVTGICRSRATDSRYRAG